MGFTLQQPGQGIAWAAPAPSDLSDIVDNAWAVDLAYSGEQAQLIPDTNVEVLVLVEAGRAPQCLVSGPLYRADLSSRNGFAVGIGLRPGAAAGFLRCDMQAIRNKAIPLTDFGWGQPDVRACNSPNQTHTALIDFVRAHRSARPVEINALTAEAVDRLQRDPRIAKAGDAASILEVSERTLRRHLRASLGVGPKTVLRLNRVRRALHLLTASPADALGEVAIDAGYFDQSHLCLDLKALTGLTPAMARHRFGLSA